jgi:hypothetical protein
VAGVYILASYLRLNPQNSVATALTGVRARLLIGGCKMRVRVISVVVCMALCLSFMPLLIPPLLPTAEAASENLNLTFTSTGFTGGSVSVLGLQTGDTITQFGRRVPNTYTYTVQSGSTSYISTVYSSVCSVSGSLNGTATMDIQTVDVTYPTGNWVGYVVGNWALDGFSGVMVGDTSASVAGDIVTKTSVGFAFAKSATEVLIGTFDGTAEYNLTGQNPVSESGTMALRSYQNEDMQLVATVTTAITGGTSSPERTATVAVGSEFLQFRPPSIVASTGTQLYYYGGQSSVQQGTFGGEPFTMTATVDSLSFWTGSPPRTAWSAGSVFATMGSNSGRGVFVGGGPGWAPGEGSESGYGISVAEYNSATGFLAGKDFYNEYASTTTGGISTVTNTVYTYGAEAVNTPPGNAILVTDSGALQGLSVVSAGSMPQSGKPDIEFPYGLFQFNITDLNPGDSVTLTIYLPSAAPTIAQYWKYGPTSTAPLGEWYQVFMGNNDGDNVITITLTDGGTGDDDLIANGTIVDQGGPGWPGPSGGGGSHSAPVFPSIYFGIGAALGAGMLAYLVSRRLAAR